MGSAVSIAVMIAKMINQQDNANNDVCMVECLPRARACLSVVVRLDLVQQGLADKATWSIMALPRVCLLRCGAERPARCSKQDYGAPHGCLLDQRE